MESRLLEILVCPICKSSLRYDKRQMELICRADKLAFPIRDGVPVMLESEARELISVELAHTAADVDTPPGAAVAGNDELGKDQ